MKQALFDTSALIPCVIELPLSKIARHMASTYEMISIDFAFHEAANTVWKYVRIGAVPVTLAAQILDAVDGLVEFRDSRPVVPGALELAIKHGHSVYDCVFVNFALTHSLPLVTADTKLAQKFAGVVPLDVINLYDEMKTP